MKTAVGQQRRNVFCPDSSKKSQSSTSNSEKPGTSITRSRELRRQIPARSRHTGKMAPVARQVLIWGLPVDPIFADGAAKLRSRAAPSARIEPHILFLTEHQPATGQEIPRTVPEPVRSRPEITSQVNQLQHHSWAAVHVGELFTPCWKTLRLCGWVRSGKRSHTIHQSCLKPHSELSSERRSDADTGQQDPE
jgi:hypothetical protein